MSLKTDFYNGITGLHEQCNAAFDAGVLFVSTINLTAISTALITNAAAGNTKFTVTLSTTYQPATLRGNKGNNLILKAYLAGIEKGLADQEIYAYECTPTLNMSDTIDTKIDLNFNFQTT